MFFTIGCKKTRQIRKGRNFRFLKRKSYASTLAVSKMDEGDLKTMTGDLIKEKAGLESGNEWKP